MHFKPTLSVKGRMAAVVVFALFKQTVNVPHRACFDLEHFALLNDLFIETYPDRPTGNIFDQADVLIRGRLGIMPSFTFIFDSPFSFNRLPSVLQPRCDLKCELVTGCQPAVCSRSAGEQYPSLFTPDLSAKRSNHSSAPTRHRCQTVSTVNLPSIVVMWGNTPRTPLHSPNLPSLRCQNE